MKSSFPKCPVCYRKHDPRWSAAGTEGIDLRFAKFLKYPTPEMRISRSDGQLHICWFDPKRTETYDQIEARLRDPEGYAAREEKIVRLRRLANHPTTPPNEALAAQAAIKRLQGRI